MKPAKFGQKSLLIQEYALPARPYFPHTNLLIKSLSAITLLGISSQVEAALVSPCAGVSLPPSVVTNIVSAAVLPVTGILDGGLSILLGPLGLSSNLTNTLGGIAAGAPINLNVLDQNGNIVSPATQCDASADSFTLDTPKGLSIGGNQITGLGSGTIANAGELNSIALGNNAVTNALALSAIAIGPNAAIGSAGTNSIAIGNGANTNVANSIALGANSSATVGAQTNYSAYGLTAPQTSVGEVSVGSAGNVRKITNVAAGSSATDAVNVAQLQAVDEGAVKYDPLSLRMTVTLGGPLSNDGGATNGTRITNLAQGQVSATSTDAVNGTQLFGVTSNLNSLGLTMATHLGGGATYNAATGAVSAPSYGVYGTTQNNVGDAIKALQENAPLQYLDVNGNPTTTATNSATLVGSTNAPVTLHNIADGVALNDAVNVNQLNQVSNNVDTLDGLAVKYNNISLETVTLGGLTSVNGGLTGGTLITNLRQGAINATSTDAINGSQLFSVTSNLNNLGITTATNLGGGATYNALTGAITAPSYSVYGTTQNDVGAAITALQTNAPIQYLDVNGVPTSTVTNNVALVGATTDPVRLQNVANGVDDTDAVNVRQLNAVSDGLNNLDGLAVKYDNTALDTVTLAGTSGTRITNLANGDVTATSTDAINGSQLFNFSNALGSSMATNLGGGATYNATTGQISQPSYNVYGTTQADVGAAITALQTQSPIQYLDASGNPTTIVTNDVTLVGNGGPVQLHNIADGVAANDAVNVSQLQAVSNTVNALDTLAVKYSDPSQSSIILNDSQLSGDGGLTGGTLLTNLQQGSISQFSTDAVNGAQLYETQQLINNITQGRIKYFQINSTLNEAEASGANSMSIGPDSEASGANSLALGVSSQASADGAVAIGFNSEASGVNSIAIGNGALATGSVAVGAGAQAGAGGAAFGDNAIANGPDQGTAIGNAAVVTASRGVALGAGASASRAGMGTTNTRERFSNAAVTSTEGAVSVGSTGAERQITNVAGGTEDTDAVNVRQLEAAISQSGFDISNQLNALRSDISTVRHDANAGTAAAIALASMPQSVMPGKAMMAAGIGHYEGQSAMSIGISNFSENGRWVLNVNGSANTRGKAGAGVGVGFHW